MTDDLQIASALEDALRQSGELTLRPSGNSMGSTFSGADALVFRPAGEGPVPVGTVVAFRRGQQWIVHRVLWRFRRDGRVRYVTKGDGMRYRDRPSVSHANLVAFVAAVRKDQRTISLRTPSARVRGLSLAMGALARSLAARAWDRLGALLRGSN